MEALILGFEQFQEYMNSGGLVMWPLFICVVVLWYALGYRFYSLNRGSNASVRNLVRKFSEGIRKKPKGMIDSAVLEALSIVKIHGQTKDTRDYITDAFNAHSVEIIKYSKLIMTIVAAAPLIGLLGTVIGMIETFDSLADAALFSQSGGIAGGISQALFTTQLGLVVAVPGLIIGNLLQRKADKMLMDLEQIKDIVCIKEKGE
ncbi:MotA/TolQ/ExbB proton channel family protein [Sulfurimonas sp. MAG313]|nr:MotA/TolQ/ExbB proton channel family protein [Sulfurimonas sp. MAG313]MDF1881441.1 MotA/TolQ/ExbB proton channel family protein [Sulfurimonas sp. MAG313]